MHLQLKRPSCRETLRHGCETNRTSQDSSLRFQCRSCRLLLGRTQELESGTVWGTRLLGLKMMTTWQGISWQLGMTKMCWEIKAMTGKLCINCYKRHWKSHVDCQRPVLYAYDNKPLKIWTQLVVEVAREKRKKKNTLVAQVVCLQMPWIWDPSGGLDFILNILLGSYFFFESYVASENSSLLLVTK